MHLFNALNNAIKLPFVCASRQAASAECVLYWLAGWCASAVIRSPQWSLSIGHRISLPCSPCVFDWFGLATNATRRVSFFATKRSIDRSLLFFSFICEMCCTQTGYHIFNNNNERQDRQTARYKSFGQASSEGNKN